VAVEVASDSLTNGVGVLNRQTIELADERTKLVSKTKDCTAPMKTKNCGLKRDPVVHKTYYKANKYTLVLWM